MKQIGADAERNKRVAKLCIRQNSFSSFLFVGECRFLIVNFFHFITEKCLTLCKIRAKESSENP